MIWLRFDIDFDLTPADCLVCWESGWHDKLKAISAKQPWLEVVMWMFKCENGISAGKLIEIAQLSNIDRVISSSFNGGY